MQSIVVGFSRPKKWRPFAWLIMKGYGIPYDHVYVKFHSGTYGRDIIYQASGSMVNFMGNTIFLSNNIGMNEFQVSISDDKYVGLMQFCIDNAGKPYGVKQAFGMAIVRIAEIFGRYIKNPFKDDGTYVCSKLGAYILENFAGAIIPRDIEDITPLDLYNYLIQVKASVESTSKP